MPATRSRRARGIMPIGESVPSGVRTVTESPTDTPSWAARSLPRRSHPARRSRTAARSDSGAAAHRAADAVTSASSAGSMPFRVMKACRRRRSPARLPEDGRRRADDVRHGPQLLPPRRDSRRRRCASTRRCAESPRECGRATPPAARSSSASAMISAITPDRDAEGRNERNHRDERLLAAGQEIAQRDVQLEGHLCHTEPGHHNNTGFSASAPGLLRHACPRRRPAQAVPPLGSAARREFPGSEIRCLNPGAVRRIARLRRGFGEVSRSSHDDGRANEQTREYRAF